MLDSKKIDEKIPKHETVMRLKASARHNLAKLELAFSYSFKAVSEYDSYRKSMGQAYHLFEQALEMSIWFDT